MVHDQQLVLKVKYEHYHVAALDSLMHEVEMPKTG